MKAPDKIYIPIYPNYNGDGTHLGDDWFTSFQNSAKDNIAYIRKDALVEWLEECKNNPVITDLQKGNIQELIDHIKSM